MAKEHKLPNKVERRYINLPVSIEQRDGDNESRTISGYAAVFNTWSDPIMWFREKIDPAAFNDVLSQDTVALFNHDRNVVLARNNATLKLSIDDKGLRYEFEAPNTTAGNDLLENVRLKNITSSSFQFSVKRAEWAKNTEDNDIEEDRTILEVERLIDVSPVTFPAYPDATVDVAKREHEAYCTEHRKGEDKPGEEKRAIPLEIFEAELELYKP